ncbi:uncharacterized protein [Asterias amurensis]|uniref:uncharacterized protein n=1 Tax=Asterias amurensis TaxID=7602 RepID=UPI003AB6EDCE
MERRFIVWSTTLVLLVPLLLELPYQAHAATFNYMAHCRDMDAGKNALFLHTVHQFGARVANVFNRHFDKDIAPPHGINRLVRMYQRLRAERSESNDINDFVTEVEDVFMLKLERLDRECTNRQILG